MTSHSGPHHPAPSLEATIRRLHNTDLLITLLTIAFCGFAKTAAAQAQEAQERDRWKVSAEFSLTDQSGNRVLTLLTGGINATHLQQQAFRLDGSVQSRYGRSEGEIVALNHQAGLAFELRLRSVWAPFLSMDAERDDFKRLDLRLATGAGAKYTFRQAEDGMTDTSLSLALLHAYERIQAAPPEEPGAIADPVESIHRARWSLRARTSHAIREGITLRHTTFYQPLWEDLANYLLRSETGAKILLTERLAFSVDYQIKRDARPPEGIEPNDRLLKTGLIIDF